MPAAVVVAVVVTTVMQGERLAEAARFQNGKFVRVS